MLVCYFKVILPDHLFMLCRRFAAPLLHALLRLCCTPCCTFPAPCMHAGRDAGCDAGQPGAHRPGSCGPAASVRRMTSPGYRRPLMIVAAMIAVLSLAAVGAVMAIAFNGGVAPVWITSTALYGLPVAFMLAVVLVLDAVRQRRRQ